MRKHKRNCTWLICAASILLASAIALIWCINWEPGVTSGDVSDKSFTRKDLLAEMTETYEELRAQGIRTSGAHLSSKYNAVVIIIHPWDAGKLQLTQNGVPDIKYFRLIRMGEEIPVYIELEFPPTHPVGLN